MCVYFQSGQNYMCVYVRRWYCIGYLAKPCAYECSSDRPIDLLHELLKTCATCRKLIGVQVHDREARSLEDHWKLITALVLAHVDIYSLEDQHGVYSICRPLWQYCIHRKGHRWAHTFFPGGGLDWLMADGGDGRGRLAGDAGWKKKHQRRERTWIKQNQLISRRYNRIR